MEEDFSPYVPDFFHDCRMFQSLFHCLESISEREPLLEIAKKIRWKQRQRRCFQWSSMDLFCFVVQKLSPRAATGGEPQNIISQTKKFRPFAIRFFHLNHSIPSLPLLSEPSSPTKPVSTVLQKFAHTDTLTLRYAGKRIYLDVSSFLHLTNINYVCNFIITFVLYSQSLAQTPKTLGITAVSKTLGITADLSKVKRGKAKNQKPKQNRNRNRIPRLRRLWYGKI